MTRLVSESLDESGWWQDWMIVVGIALAIAFYWLVDWFGGRQDRPIAASWARAAEALNGTFRSKHQGFSDMHIEGTDFAGVKFQAKRVMTDTYGGVATRYEVKFEDPTLPEFLVVGKGTVNGKVRWPRVMAGDDRYDSLLRIRSRDERTPVYLTPQVLELAVDLVSRYNEVSLDNTQIVIQSKDLEPDGEVVRRTLTMLLEATRLMSPQLRLTPAA